MDDKLMEINNKLEEQNSLNVDNAQEILSEIVAEIQNNCIKSEFGKAVSSALDIGIRAIFPDVVEDQIINLKDNIYNYGLKDGLGKTVQDAVDFGKSAIGVLTNDFDSISQARSAVAAGGTIDKISDLLDTGIDSLKSSKIIDSSTAKTLKSGKNSIIKNLEKNIDTSFTNQMKDMEKLEKYITNWNECFNEQDFTGMEREFNKMKKIMDTLLPVEDTFVDYRTIENLHTLIKNNGKDFDLSQEELDLANKLIN